MKRIFERYGIEFEELGIRKENTVISVYCLTYNHVQFIRKALESFREQIVSVPMEVFIYDDASTDGTSEIVKEYCEKYPELYHAIIAKKNTYGTEISRRLNVEFKNENLTGKYVAWCEGDDYWTYNYKLQRQFDFMEVNPDCSLCVHNAIRYDKNIDEIIPQIIDMDSGFESDEEVICCNHGRIPTASYFYRKELVCFDALFFKICPVGDEPLRFWLAYCGNVYYMDKVWAVRNYMHVDSWNYDMQNNAEHKYNMQKKYANFFVYMDNVTDYRFHKYFVNHMNTNCWGIVNYLYDDLKTVSQLYDDLRVVTNECKEELSIYLYNWFFEYRRKCIDYYTWIQKCIVDRGKKVYIYGAGEEAGRLAEEYSKNGIVYESFIVSRDVTENEKLLGHKIISVKDINMNNENVYIELGMNSDNRLQVLEIYREKLTVLY